MTRWAAVLAATAAVAGCGQRDDRAGAADSVHLRMMPMDSGMMVGSGARHAGLMRSLMMDSVLLLDSLGGRRAGMMMQPARDADQLFLRLLSDHHEGLILACMQAMDEARSDAARADARRLYREGEAERDSMVALLREVYQDEHLPMAVHQNVVQADSLSRAKGAAYDEDYYRLVVEHRQQGVAIIDGLLPRLQRPEVRAMAERMKAEQEREIPQFQQKREQAATRRG